MKKNISKKLAKRKRKINKRVKKIQWPQQPKPMMAGSNIVYDIDGRHQGTAYGGIGNIHQLAARSGLIDETDKRIQLLKRLLPYQGDKRDALNLSTSLNAIPILACDSSPPLNRFAHRSRGYTKSQGHGRHALTQLLHRPVTQQAARFYLRAGFPRLPDLLGSIYARSSGHKHQINSANLTSLYVKGVPLPPL